MDSHLVLEMIFRPSNLMHEHSTRTLVHIVVMKGMKLYVIAPRRPRVDTRGIELCACRHRVSRTSPTKEETGTTISDYLLVPVVPIMSYH